MTFFKTTLSNSGFKTKEQWMDRLSSLRHFRPINIVVLYISVLYTSGVGDKKITKNKIIIDTFFVWWNHVQKSAISLGDLDPPQQDPLLAAANRKEFNILRKPSCTLKIRILCNFQLLTEKSVITENVRNFN